MAIFEQYVANIRRWLFGFINAWSFRKLHADVFTRTGLFKFWLIQFFDVGANVLTGGDVETLSSNWFKDRDTLLGGAMTRILNAIDPGHGERAENLDVGEGSSRNRELPGRIRFFLTAFWVMVIGATVQALFF